MNPELKYNISSLRIGDFYLAKGLMRRYDSANQLAVDANLALHTLQETFESHILYGEGKVADPLGKREFLDDRST